MGPWVLINAGWYKSALMTGLGALPPFMLNEGLVTMGSEQAFAAPSTNDGIWHKSDIQLPLALGPRSTA